MLERITSLKNVRVKYWRELNRKSEKEAGRIVFFAEGEHMVSEALSERKACELIISEKKQERFSELVHLACDQNICTYIVTDDIINSITETKAPQGICCVCCVERPLNLDGRRIVALEKVQDPGNVGTVMRTMDAFGYDVLVVDVGCADPYSAKASRASMGAVFRIPVFISDDLPGLMLRLRQNGSSIIAGELHGKNLRDVCIDKQNSSCILVGNEGAGLSKEVLDTADVRVRIPMPGKAESLNAAIAASILMYEMME